MKHTDNSATGIGSSLCRLVGLLGSQNPEMVCTPPFMLQVRDPILSKLRIDTSGVGVGHVPYYAHT